MATNCRDIKMGWQQGWGKTVCVKVSEIQADMSQASVVHVSMMECRMV
jgi:hypothetical protein